MPHLQNTTQTGDDTTEEVEEEDRRETWREACWWLCLLDRKLCMPTRF